MIGLEAIASRLKAIAIRLEAIAFSNSKEDIYSIPESLWVRECPQGKPGQRLGVIR